MPRAVESWSTAHATIRRPVQGTRPPAPRIPQLLQSVAIRSGSFRAAPCIRPFSRPVRLPRKLFLGGTRLATNHVGGSFLFSPASQDADRTCGGAAAWLHADRDPRGHLHDRAARRGRVARIHPHHARHRLESAHDAARGDLPPRLRRVVRARDVPRALPQAGRRRADRDRTRCARHPHADARLAAWLQHDQLGRSRPRATNLRVRLHRQENIADVGFLDPANAVQETADVCFARRSAFVRYNAGAFAQMVGATKLSVKNLSNGRVRRVLVPSFGLPRVIQ
jgi:hypothetical protein